jgi:hypothetical protein
MTEFAIEHILVFVVIVLRVMFNTDPQWLNVFKKRSKHREQIKMLQDSKEKRYVLLKRRVKK